MASWFWFLNSNFEPQGEAAATWVLFLVLALVLLLLGGETQLLVVEERLSTPSAG